jgi:hypothetical protein
LGLTPTELALILEEQHEFMWNELAQPPTQPIPHYNLVLSQLSFFLAFSLQRMQ